MHINKKTFCIHPFTSISTSASDQYMNCCMSSQLIKKEDSSLYRPSTDTLQAAFDSPFMDNLRASIKNGIRHKNCELCWEEEASGKDSKRIRDSSQYLDSKKSAPTTHTLKSVDLKLGNLCNLKCRICNPWNSSKWVDEWHALRAATEDKKEYTKQFAVIRKMWNPDQTIWDGLREILPGIEHMDLYGGEPLLIENMWNILQHSVDQGYASKQTIHYNTNGSIVPTNEQLEIWSNFKSIDIQVSVDDIGARHHYQRHPSRWDDVKRNIDKFKQYQWIRLSTNATVSNFNIYYLDEITNEITKNIGVPIWYNMLHRPVEISIEALSLEIKEILVAKLGYLKSAQPDIESVLNLVASKPDSGKIVTFLQQVAEQDAYRNESFETTFPEWYAILKQHYL